MAILIEHYGGKWPVWISPRQVQIIPISAQHSDHCKQIYDQLHENGWNVEMDQTDASLNKKVRNAQLKQFNYIAVIGDEEIESQTVDVRSRNGDRIGKFSVSEFEKRLIDEYPDSFPLPGTKSKKVMKKD